MSEQKQKWQEEFEKWQNTDIEQFSGELKWKDVNCSARDAFLVAKRQDAERIAELEETLDSHIRESADTYMKKVDAWGEACIERDELRAKLEALEKQEPACWQQFANGMPTQNIARTYHEKDEITGMLKCLNPAVIIEWEPLYAAPKPPPTNEGEV